MTHTAKIYPNAGLVKNYCRNPAPDESAKTIWCFIEGGTPLHFWEYCDPLGGVTKPKGTVTIKSIESKTVSSKGSGGVKPGTKI